uniref:Uncharacterized protein n=1 Tax=Anguilla anguilla TaxID=7936 RepID=A0A0E9XNH4_ANGAN
MFCPINVISTDTPQCLPTVSSTFTRVIPEMCSKTLQSEA